MNKKISYGCLIFCMALYSIDGFAAKRNTSRASSTTSRVRSSSLVSGYSNKYFKNPSVTLVEKRSVELEPLMFTENIANIKKTLNGSTAVDSKYRLCIPCQNIYLTYNDGIINKTLQGDSMGEGNCYSLDADTPNEYYKLAVKTGAIEACGEKLRMTILDIKNKDVHTEIDSVVLNIVPNSSLYDYSNIKLGQDTEIYELIDNYTEAKNAAKAACSDNIKSHLEAFKKALVGTTVTSSLTTVTGGVDTVLQTKGTIKAFRNEGSTDTAYTKAVKECFKKETGKEMPETCSDAIKDCEYKKYSCEQKNESLKEEEDKYTKCMTECAKEADIEKRYTCESNCSTQKGNLTGAEIASVALSGASAAGNITTMAISISVAKQVDDLLDDLKKCKAAADKMHMAGMALEAGLEEITSADE